ncbi:hypothetical protein MPDQ_003104 [Monascus purpureus]|uniref:Calponin-homology (CH) domain-containing protein n=1 Tax=Monascus purpureus TaxID=5098 RepID=A0A507QZC1_MONPU|nr:hypothetical protein MPDQ_003104 [Monascus purpureus]
MADLLDSISTPCPSRLKTSRSDRSSNGTSAHISSLESRFNYLDNTRELDYAAGIRAPVLTGAKPRRRNRTGASSFQIHEDEEAKAYDRTGKNESKVESTIRVSNRKSSLLAQPAQRFRPKVSFATNMSSWQETRSKFRPARDNVEINIEESSLGKRDGTNTEERPKDVYKKAVRRNTVYIPPDDTTVASAFMGLFSPLKSQDINYNIPEDTLINSLEAQIARKRLAKKSSTTSTRRAPLQASSKIPQQNMVHVDIPGKNGGKENIPPGTLLNSCDDKTCGQKMLLSDERLLGSRGETDKVLAPFKNQSRPNKVQNSMGIGNKTLSSKEPSTKRAALVTKQNKANISTASNNISRRKFATEDKFSSTTRSSVPITLSKVTVPAPRLRSRSERYPLLTEDISNPAMYEDNWLSHQEIAITQLVNQLFDYANGSGCSTSSETLRQELLRIYQTDFFTQLYGRVKASLLYGSLGIPKDIVRSSRLKHDVGLKRKFLDVWLQVYDPASLRAAAETVLGRRIPHQPNATGESNKSEKMLKRDLEVFLDTFLLQNEDMHHHTTDAKSASADVASWEYARTVLRSIMIIILLDKGRVRPGAGLPCCLFTSSSPYKSSAAVLQALGRLLLPSSGDITKQLSHLGCNVYYKQHQRKEYDYHIENLAVDLRDGVRLTRIVEILLYPSTSFLNNANSDLDTLTTSRVQNGRTVSEEYDDWPLSQQLKFPCTSRAAKLFNVCVALEALASANGGGVIVGNTRAEDVVDGHREKSIALLWGLVSKWGLSGLVDWDDLRKEIDRLKRKAKDSVQSNEERQLDSQDDEHTSLLTQWASLLAGLKGLRIENLTTSFADGTIYESIVEEYEDYILENATRYGQHIDEAHNNSKAYGSPLALRLRALGCSSQFGGDREVVEKSKDCKTAPRTYNEDEKSTWEDWLTPWSMKNV